MAFVVHAPFRGLQFVLASRQLVSRLGLSLCSCYFACAGFGRTADPPHQRRRFWSLLQCCGRIGRTRQDYPRIFSIGGEPPGDRGCVSGIEIREAPPKRAWNVEERAQFSPGLTPLDDVHHEEPATGNRAQRSLVVLDLLSGHQREI